VCVVSTFLEKKIVCNLLPEKKLKSGGKGGNGIYSKNEQQKKEKTNEIQFSSCFFLLHNTNSSLVIVVDHSLKDYRHFCCIV
jgi:hypothetical protein